MGVEEHKARAPERVRCFVVTVSDTRTKEDDISGGIIQELLKSNFHHVMGYQIVKDDAEQVKALVSKASQHPQIQVIILSGGTGISARDNTYEALRSIYQKDITGFGEIFRFLSFQEIGSSAMLSRASSGVVNGRLVFSMPGSEQAVKLCMQQLVLPELGHMVYAVVKDTAGFLDATEEEEGAPAGGTSTEG